MEEAMSEKIVPMKTYAAIFITLVVLTVVTYRVAFIDLGVLNVVVALTIAATKATLVALFFMHVVYSPRRTPLVVLTGVFWLAILIVLTMGDYLTRHPVH